MDNQTFKLGDKFLTSIMILLKDVITPVALT